MAGTLLTTSTQVFEKIEDEIIEYQINKLKFSNKNQTKFSPMKDEITFDEFSKMDIRVGIIKAAEKVEKADKLLKLEVDMGSEQRTVVSGIAEHYTPEEVIGKRVSILANLASRKIRGVESKGMILMAEDADGKLSFVSPEDGWQNGATVC